MPRYIATVRFRLPTPIAIAPASVLAPISPSYPADDLVADLTVRLIVVADLASELELAATYDAAHLDHVLTANPEGVGVLTHDGYIHAPLDLAGCGKTLLYHLSALTRQPDIFSPRLHLEQHMTSFTWTLPNGTVRPGAAAAIQRSVAPVFAAQPLSSAHWQRLRDPQPAPTWQLLLADAVRECHNDMRTAVILAASALESAVQPHLPPGIRFGIEHLDGTAARIPDMRDTTRALGEVPLHVYRTASQLWYTRNAIIHRGQIALFEEPPHRGAAPMRDLRSHDVLAFVAVVPSVERYFSSSGAAI